MEYSLLSSFSGLAASSRATLEIPNYAKSLGRILLQFGGGLTKANISEITVKVGSRTVFGPVSATVLDKINKYRGQFDLASMITIDLTERDGLSILAKEIGAIDLPSLRGQKVFVEVTNTLASGSPTLVAMVGYTTLQFIKDDNPKNDREQQLIHKLLRYQVPSSGGTRMVWMPDFRGAKIKRVHFEYAGTDWTASANGNLHTVECRRNGQAVWDRIQCLPNRFICQEQGKVPQSRMYTLDFVHDNSHGAALNTAGLKALEFNLDVTAVDSVTAYVECLDLPSNL